MELRPVSMDRPLPLQAAADLQDNLLMVANDLDRLQTLLADACDGLLCGFCVTTGELRALPAADGPAGDAVARAISRLSDSVIALQFQDMATQLIAHTQQRLRHCTDRIAHEAMADDGDDDYPITEAPSRPNPVTQDEMDAGSVDLF